jgi:1-acyl-sn-glycerol-3-phosphate acyltransferase
MKKILRSIYGIYGALIWCIAALIAFPWVLIAFTFFGDRYEKQMIYLAYKISCRFILIMSGLRLKIIGAEKLDPKASYIIASNHQSTIDIPVNANAFPGLFKFLSKAEAAKVPVFGTVIKRICILLDRKSQESRKNSYKELRRQADLGYSVLIYVEGTRNRGKELLQPFFDGAFRLSVETGLPMAVQTLKNTGQMSNPRRLLDLRPGTVICYWDLVTPNPEWTEKDIPAYKEMVRNIMLERLKQF